MTTTTIANSPTVPDVYSVNGVTLVNAGVEGSAIESQVGGPDVAVYITGNNDTLINNGAIYGYNESVHLNGSGNSVINALGMTIAADGPGLAAVWFNNGSGTVTNYGVISGFPNAVNGSITLVGKAVELDGGGIVTNSGTLLNGGVTFLGAVATVINSGVILGNDTYGAVYMKLGGQVTNLSGGVISANGAVVSYNALPPYGIYIHGGAGTVTNAGTIVGGGLSGNTGYAVELSAGFQNRLIVDPGAVFIGAVTGGTAVDATLELASGASTGTLSGFGTQFTNFGTLTLDPSASWLVQASTAVTAAVINGFAANDTIDLAGFVAASRTFANNTLVLTDAGTDAVTLQIQGTLTTGNFSLGGDGNGGTDITFSPVALAYGQTIDEAGIIATSETVTASTMALYNGTTLVGTLGVGPGLSSGDFILQPDNASGTEVIVNTIFGTYTTGVTLLVNSTTIASTAAITGSLGGATGIFGPSGTAWTLTNLGVVSETGAGSDGVSFASAGTVINAATIAGYQDGIVLAAGGSVTNQLGGTISGFDGVIALSGLATVVNAGIIAGSYTANGADGVNLQAGGSVTNQSGGRITGYLDGVRISTAPGTVVNLGYIDSIPNAFGGVGVDLADGGLVTNGAAGGTVSSAYIGGYSGGVSIEGINGTLTNYGTIDGLPGATAVDMSSGTVINGPSGATGARIVGGGSGVMIGGAGTVVNYGAITGGGNTDNPNYYGVRLAGAGSISNLGTNALIEAFVGVYAVSNDTVTNAGMMASNNGTDGIALVFGGGTNRLIIDPGARFIGTVSGSGPVTLAPNGNTQVIGTAHGIGTTTLELASASGAGTLSGLGTQFVGFAAVTIDAGANWTLSGTNTLVAGATLTNAGTLTDTGTLFNSGTLTGNPLNLNGGALTNRASGVLTATYVYGVGAGGTDTVVNQGTMTNATGAAIYLGASGSVTNAAGGVVTGDGDAVRLAGTNASVSNLGQIIGTGVNPSYGVYMRNGGVVTNGQGGAGTSTAAIQGYYGVAFKLSQTGTVANYGTIIGTGADGFGVGLSGNGGLVTNGPGGAAGALIQGGRFGVYSGTGSVINEATIIATGTFSGDYGIEINGAGSVSNLGPASLIEGYGGVRIDVDGTITNAGTIESNQGTAGVAVAFTGGDSRLIVDPGAVFVGSIYGGSGGTATLELASGSSAGILAGFGTTMTNFTSLMFDTGAAWTIAGNDLPNGLGTLGISGFTINDTIDLTGFVATGRTFAGNTLTLTAAGGAQETLTFQGGFTTGNFVINSDGNLGTDVSFLDLPVISGTAAGQPVTDEATVHPFSGVTISDANIGSQAETVTITLTNGGTVTGTDGTLSGAGVIQTAVGIYTLSAASAGAITTALDALVFTPTAHQVAPGDTVTTGFSIEVTDTAGGTSSDSATTVIATAANDPPVITGAITGQTTTDEATITPLSGISVSDVDFGQTETVTVTLSSATNGTLSDVDGGSFNSGTGVYTIIGTDSTVTTALGALVFTPTAHQVAPGSSVTTTFTIHATDTAGGTSSNSTTTVGVTAVNDPPVITGAIAGQTTTDETTITPLSGVSISDVDFGQTETVTVTLSSAANGTLSDVDGGSFNSGTGVYSITGTDSTVTTALDALVFTPTAHQAAPGSTVTTTFTIHTTDTAGGTSSNSTTTVGVTAVNDPPVITGAITGQTTTDETTITPLSGISISDVDFGQTETVTVTLSSAANGTLSDVHGGSFNSGTGVYTITGTDSTVTTALDALVFTPTAHQVAPGSTVTTTFTIHATDTAGGTSSDSATTVIATAANDPPVITGAITGQTTTDEATITPLSGISVSDVDFGQTETVTVTLSSAANGTLSDVHGGSFNTNTGVYSITGTDSTVTTALDALVFTPTAHQVAPGSTVTTTFTIHTTDTAGGTSSNSTTTVGVTAVNDPPVITGAIAGQTTTDETTITPLSGVSISDVDFGQTETVTVTLSSAANGTLSDVHGGTFNSGTGVYSITGTDSTVTTALDALVFTPTAHQAAPGSTVTTTFTIHTTDTAGGTSSNSTTTVGVTAVNDPPVITGAITGQTTTDETTITPLSGVSISDVDFGQTETVTVTLSSAGNGTLSDVDGGSFNSGTGVYTITGTDGTVTTALDALVFTPTAHQVAPGSSVTTTFTIHATDTAGGTSSNSTTTVIVTAVNDPPVITGAIGRPDHHRRGDDHAFFRHIDQRRRLRPDRDGDRYSVIGDQRHAVGRRRRQLQQWHRRLHHHRHRQHGHHCAGRAGVHANRTPGGPRQLRHHHFHHPRDRYRRWDQQQQHLHGRRHRGQRPTNDHRCRRRPDHHRRDDDHTFVRRVDQRRRFRPDRNGDRYSVIGGQRHAVGRPRRQLQHQHRRLQHHRHRQRGHYRAGRPGVHANRSPGRTR